MKKLSWLWALGIAGLIALPACTIDPTYTRCSTSADCEVSEECFQITTSVTNGNFCSSNCSADSQCERNLGFAGSCMDPDGNGGICFQECVLDVDCFSSSVCVEFIDNTGFLNFVCLPQN